MGTLVKVSELLGIQLNWAVAKCLGLSPRVVIVGGPCVVVASGFEVANYAADWLAGGSILFSHKISTAEAGQGYWNASIYQTHHSTGNTPLEAGMRTYVKSVLGHQVEIPEELL